MKPSEADRWKDSAAAYLHTPFCSQVCPYCDFAVVAGRDDLVERYIDALCLEIGRSAPWRTLDAIYFGGGTPSHIQPGLLSTVIRALEDKHGVAGDTELSVEANPEDVTAGLAEGLLSAGFNRLSLGAQSFDSDVLGYLGRRHDAETIGNAVDAARTAGFDNISLDLIYGSPGESDESWRATLRSAVAAGPDHVSCYALTVEPGTPLGRRVRDGETSPDPDVQADRYEAAQTVLGAEGFDRYEVSNWARPGKECHYNLIVWAQGEYQAHGNGAHGHLRGVRFRNYRRLDKYLEAVEAGESVRAGIEAIGGWDAEIDRLFVGLRRTVGVKSGPGTEALLHSTAGRLLTEAGVIEQVGDRLVVLRPLMTDEVHRAILGLNHDDMWEQGPGPDNVSVKADA